MVDGVLYFVTGSTHVYFGAMITLASSLCLGLLYYFTFEMQEVKSLLTWQGSVLDFMRSSARRTKVMVLTITLMMLLQSCVIILQALSDIYGPSNMRNALDLVLRMPKVLIDLTLAYYFVIQVIFFAVHKKKMVEERYEKLSSKQISLLVWVLLLWLC